MAAWENLLHEMPLWISGKCIAYSTQADDRFAINETINLYKQASVPLALQSRDDYVWRFLALLQALCALPDGRASAAEKLHEIDGNL